MEITITISPFRSQFCFIVLLLVGFFHLIFDACIHQNMFVHWLIHAHSAKFISNASKHRNATNEFQFVFLSFVHRFLLWVYFRFIHLPCGQQFCKWFVIGLSCIFVGNACVYSSRSKRVSSRSVCMHVMVFVCNLVGCWWKIWILCAIGYKLKLACTTHPIQ